MKSTQNILDRTIESLKKGGVNDLRRHLLCVLSLFLLSSFTALATAKSTTYPTFIQFDIKIIQSPQDASAAFHLKLESSDKRVAIETELTEDIKYRSSPVKNEWRTYRFSFEELLDTNPDVVLKSIEKVMIYPTWGKGKGTIFRLDNVFIENFASEKQIIFDGIVNEKWPAWDCCGGSEPEIIEENNQSANKVIEFAVKNGNYGTVLGFNASELLSPSPIDLSTHPYFEQRSKSNNILTISRDFSKGISFKTLSDNDFALIGSVYSIIKDPSGFLWFGGSDGLARYDGYTSEIFRNTPSDPKSISHDSIKDLLVDSEGTLWIATEVGLNKFDHHKNTFERYLNASQDENSISNSHVTSLAEDSSGNLWVGTAFGLNKFSKKTGKVERFFSHEGDSGLSHDFINDVFIDAEHNVWVATVRGLNRLNQDRKTFTSWTNFGALKMGSVDANVKNIYEDDLGRFWILTHKAFHLFDKSSADLTIYHFDTLGDLEFISMSSGPIGKLWIATNKGLIEFAPTANTFKYYNNQDSESWLAGNKFPSTIYSDNSETVWFGTFPKGVNFINQSSYVYSLYRSSSNELKGLSNNSVLSITEDAKENLIVGTDGGGLNYFDREKNRFTHYMSDDDNSDLISGEAVLSTLISSDGKIWLGHWQKKLDILDVNPDNTFKKNKVVTKWVNQIQGANIWTLLEDSSNNVWVGTVGNGLSRLNVEQKKLSHYIPIVKLQDTFSSFNVWHIFEDKQQELWFGTSDGLNLYNPQTDRFTRYQHDSNDPNSLSNNTITHINQDDDGRLWIGTRGGGINTFDKKTQQFTNYTTEDGLPDNNIAAVVVDGDDLWISTFTGICRFNIRKRICRGYDYLNGQAGNIFNLGAGTKLTSGEIAFGGTEGLIIFDPMKIKNNLNIPPVVITGFEIFNQSISPKDNTLETDISYTKNITLNHLQTMFTIEFSALDFKNSSINKYLYKLEGYDKDWISSGSSRRATYTNMDPGDYVFKVKGSNNEGVWNEQGKTLKITILPPWWKTDFAYGAMILLTLSAFYFYIRRHQKTLSHERQVNQKLKLTEEKLTETALKLNESVKASGIGIWEWDFATHKLIWDDKVFEIYGYKNEIEQDLFDLWQSRLHPEDAQFAKNALEQAIQTQNDQTIEYRIFNNDGETHWLRSCAAILKSNKDDTLRLVGTIQDISQSKLQEKGLLNTQQVALAGQLSAGICHDLNNVLNVISGYAELIELKSKTTDVTEFSIKIQDGISRAKSVTSRLLTLAKPHEEIFSNVELDKVLTEELSFYEKALTKTVRLKVNLESRASVRIDSATFKDVALNLIINAQKAMNEKGLIAITTYKTPRFTPRSAYVHCHPLRANEYAVMSIKDTGVGISEDQIEKIFSPFFTNRSNNGGSGLGLAVVSAFAVNNRCGLTVASELGEGTEFKLWLPIEKNTTVLRNSNSLREQQSIEGLNILVIDDQESLLKMYVEILNLSGAGAFGLSDPMSAKKHIESNSEDLDVVITDQSLNGLIKGHELITWIKSSHPHIKCLLMTGNASDPELSNVDVTIIEKPAHIGTVLEALTNS